MKKDPIPNEVIGQNDCGRLSKRCLRTLGQLSRVGGSPRLSKPGDFGYEDCLWAVANSIEQRPLPCNPPLMRPVLEFVIEMRILGYHHSQVQPTKLP